MRNGRNFGYITFAALVLALCLVPSLGMLLPEGGGEAGGNQVLTAPPSLTDETGRLDPDYLSDLTAYLEDSHFLRQEMISAWSALNAGVLATSISDQVILGTEGWLYYRETVDDYVGTGLLDGREIFSAARNLALVDQYCQSQGASFLFTIAPNKNSLYDEHMPDLTRLSEGSNADALARALAEEGVAYLDLFAVFENQEEVLYFTQDSHWNEKGAALAADAVNAALGRESNYFAGPFSEGEGHLGDLCEMIFPAGGAPEPAPAYGGAFTFTYDVPIRSAENQTIMTTGGGEGALLLFRDSFGNLLYPYLAESFGRALFSRAMPIRLDMIAQREADTVVLELVERNIDYLIRYVPVMPAPLETAGTAEPAAGRSLALTAMASQKLPGYVLVSGTLPGPADTDSRVYLAGAEGWYEAFLLEDGGFALYVPEAELMGQVSILYTAEGRVWALEAAI